MLIERKTLYDSRVHSHNIPQHHAIYYAPKEPCTDNFRDVFSLRDEIDICPFIEVHLKLKDKTPFFVQPYPMHEEEKKVIQKEMTRLKHLGIIQKGLTSYSSLVVLVKWKNQNLY